MNLAQFGQKYRTAIVVILGVFFVGIIGHSAMCGCRKEGFANNSSLGTELSYSIGDGVKSSWEKPSTRKTNDYNIMDTRPSAAVPLPASEMLIFDKTKFSPECCPSIYSNSMGCVCATTEQMNFLNQRGGNRTLTSEY